MNKIDILNRKNFLDRLFLLTNFISKNNSNVSFAINGDWGCGKSFVIDLYEEKLRNYIDYETNSNKYFIVHYNCWKYDYYEEPLVAIASVMTDIIAEDKKIFKHKKEKARILKILKSIGSGLIKYINDDIKNKFGFDINKGIKTMKRCFNISIIEDCDRSKYDTWFLFNKSLECLRGILKFISERQTIVIVVDELDRCLPEYSIKVLERLHHLTEGTSNIITVIATDKAKLSKTIKNRIGIEDVDGYLKKFIQFEIELDKGKLSGEFFKKYSDYVSLFDGGMSQNSNDVVNVISRIFNFIDVRSQEQIIYQANLIHRMLLIRGKDYSFMAMEILLTTIYKHYDLSMKSFDIRYSNVDNYVFCLDNVNKQFSMLINALNDIIKEIMGYSKIDDHFRQINKEDRLREPERIRYNGDQNSLNFIIVYYFIKLCPNKGFVISGNFEENLIQQNIEDLNNFIMILEMIK